MISTSVKEFWRRNSIAVLHTPVLLVLLLCSYIGLKALDPRIGLEGFGDIFGYLTNAFGAAVVIFSARFFKKTAWHDVAAKCEADLYHEVRQGSRGATVAKLIDRGEWIFLLVFFAWLIFQ
jgi:hypothetical protein